MLPKAFAEDATIASASPDPTTLGTVPGDLYTHPLPSTPVTAALTARPPPDRVVCLTSTADYWQSRHPWHILGEPYHNGKGQGLVYVCICNAVTEDHVRGCVAAGACSTRQVKQACGWKPGCGSCTGRLKTAIAEAHLATAQLTVADLEVESPAA